MSDGESDWLTWFQYARAQGHPGDLLVLADEAPTPELRADAWVAAAEAARRAGRIEFALEQLDRARSQDAAHAGALAELALCRQEVAVPAALARPRQVLLFSGHMVDAPDRPVPRFPSGKVPLAAQRIAEVLTRLDAGPGDLALTQGACGGDLLFTEACLARRVPVAWLQPLTEAGFIDASVACDEKAWLPRYHEAKARLAAPPRTAPESLGPPPQGRGYAYPYERCNLWLLYTAVAIGGQAINLVCLWDGGGGDGPGGTAHMVQEVRRRGGRVEWIDTRSL